MNRSIKISDEVYLDLQKLQRPRETISGVIARLINIRELLSKAEPLIGEYTQYLEQRRAELEKQHPVD